MTKSELIQFLEPFTDDVEIDLLTPLGIIIPLADVNYRLPDGEGRILLIPAKRLDAVDDFEDEAA